jgi:hypothetical protein
MEIGRGRWPSGRMPTRPRKVASLSRADNMRAATAAAGPGLGEQYE